MLEPFQTAFFQRGLLELLLLSVAGGLLGTWIVLRGLAFYSHAVGTAAFPGLVLADGLGLAAPLGAFAAALAVALAVERLARRRRGGYDELTALVLVGALAVGVVLASDVFRSGSSIESLLFGSLFLVGSDDLALAAAASGAVLVAGVLLGRRWLAIGFDPDSARSLGVRSALPDGVLLVLVALAVTSALAATGALLTTALFVVPAATVRLCTRRLLPWQVGSVALVAVEGTAGLWLSVQSNVPPGSAIAALAGAVFVLTAAARAVVPRLSVRRAGAATVGTLALLAVSGCGSSGSGEAGTTGGSSIDVVASTTVIADWVRQVGGAAVDVHGILSPNSDPHDYELRPADVEATSGAAVVFENGDGLDRWMEEVVSQAGGDPAVVVLGDRLPVRLAGEESSPVDPHWWHDPRNAAAAVRRIRDALARADRAHAAALTRRAAAYVRKVEALDRGIAACVRRIPAPGRKLVTDHDAFAYFARRYGLRVVGAVIPAQTTQAQPSAGETAGLVALIERERVRAVFPERSLSPRVARAVARETGATVGTSLYGDALGPPGSSGATYLAMEQANADAVVRGLTGGASGCAIPGLT